MKLTAISRQILEAHRKKKEQLKTYKKEVLSRKIKELRQTLAPQIFANIQRRKIGAQCD